MTRNDRKTDIETFRALSSDVFKLIICQQKITSKQRPLPLTLEDINDKI